MDHEALQLAIARPGARDHERRLQRPRLRAFGREGPRRGREPAAEPPARAQARWYPRPRRSRSSSTCSAAAAARARGRSTRTPCVRPCPRPSREHWDREIRLFEPDRARGRSFYYGGSSGSRRARNPGVDPPRRAALGGRRAAARRPHVEEQLGIYRREVRERLLGERLLRLVGSAPVMALVGVPEPQRRMVLGPARRVPRLPARLHRPRHVGRPPARELLLERLPPRLLLARELPALPRGGELRSPQGRARRQRAHVHGHGHGVPGSRERADHRVRAPRPHGLARSRTRACSRRSGRASSAVAGAGARVIFRSGGGDETFLPLSVLRRLRFDHERAAALHRRDRVGTYASFHIARLAFAALRTPTRSASPRSTASTASTRRSTTGRALSCSSTAPRRCERSDCARASSCSTSAAAPAGACRASTRPARASWGSSPRRRCGGRPAARLEKLDLARRRGRRPAALRQHRQYEGRVDAVLFSYSLSMIPPFAGGARAGPARPAARRAHRGRRLRRRVGPGGPRPAPQPRPPRPGASRGAAPPLRAAPRAEVRSLGLWSYVQFMGERAD